MEPQVTLLPFDHLDASSRERARHHLQDWLRSYIEINLSPLCKLSRATFEGPARGLIFQLRECLGIVSRVQVADLVCSLEAAERRKLYRLGVRLGYHDIYLQALMRPTRLEMRHRLWKLTHPKEEVPSLPEPGRVTIEVGGSMGDKLLSACGYRVAGDKAVRVDILDRFTGIAHDASKRGTFVVNHEMMSLLGLDRAGLDDVLVGLGYKGSGDIEKRRYKYSRTQKKPGKILRRNRKPELTAFSDLRRLLERK